MLRDVSVQMFVVVAVVTGAVVGAGHGVGTMALAAGSLAVAGLVLLAMLWAAARVEREDASKG